MFCDGAGRAAFGGGHLVIRELWGNLLVWPVAGAELTASLEAAGMDMLKPYISPGEPVLHADIRYSHELAAAMLAVGSGTVNDLIKYASGVKNVRYAVIPTAPSVDGYTSFGAAFTVDEFKKTVSCPMPLAIVEDPAILETAPHEMFAAGKPSGNTSIIRQVKAMIDQNYSNQELNVERIAELLQMHRVLLSRSFSTQYHMSISEYLIGKRIPEALKMIRETTIPIQEISTRCGFSEPGYFSKVICHATGSSPQQLREYS